MVLNLLYLEINEAYSILSDSQEKTWYDRHRETIIRNWNVETQNWEHDGIIKFLTFGELFFNFITQASLGYEECQDEFYSRYRNVFNAIKDGVEEINMLENELERRGQSRVETHIVIFGAPSFGDAETQLAEVCQFYHYWENLTNFIEAAWMNFCYPEFPGREMNPVEESYQQRMELRKRYIKIVRYLIQYVKLQDPRYHKYLENQGLLITEEEIEADQDAEKMLKDLLVNGIQRDELVCYSKRVFLNCIYFEDENQCCQDMCYECWNWAASTLRSIFKVNLKDVNWSETMLRIFVQAATGKSDNTPLDGGEEVDFKFRPDRVSRRLKKANFRVKSNEMSEQEDMSIVLKGSFCKRKFLRKNVLSKKPKTVKGNSLKNAKRK